MSVRVHLIDQSLIDASGHHLEYSLAVRAAYENVGIRVDIHCHRSASRELVRTFGLRPRFQQIWIERDRGSILRTAIWVAARLTGFSPRISWPARSFGADLAKVVSEASEDTYFIHTLGFAQFAQLASIASDHPEATFHVVLRQDPFAGSVPKLKKFLLQRLFNASRLPNVSLYADTLALCAAFTEISGQPVRQLPILFNEIPLQENTGRAPFRAVYLGDARREKGFQHLPAIIEDCLLRGLAMEFVVQCHLSSFAECEPELVHAKEKLLALQARSPEQVRIVPGILDSKEYLRLLLESELALVPYDKEAYRYRSSGILAQAWSAGKMTVSPANTSMTSEGPAALSHSYRDPTEIPSLIENLLRSPPPKDARLRAAQDFRDRNSAAAFRQVLGLSPD